MLRVPTTEAGDLHVRHYMPPEHRLSRKLHAFRPWRWLLDLNPFWVTVVLIVISPVMMWINDLLLVHGRFIHPADQWLSAQFDIALAMAAGLLVGVLRKRNRNHFPSWMHKRWPHVLIVLLAFALGMAHVWQERGSIPELERRLGPNSLYHNLLLYVILGYTLALLLLATIGVIMSSRYHPKRTFAGALLAVALVGAWAWAGTYDRTHQYTRSGVHKSEIANPTDPWCGGLITRPMCGPPDR